MCFAGYYRLSRVPNPKWKVVVPAVCDVLRPINKDVVFRRLFVWYSHTLNRCICPARTCGFITSILKSLVILANWFALIGAIKSQIAPFYTLNRIFFSANETALLKHSNQTNFKACLKKSIKLQEMRDKFCNFLQTSLLHWINKIPVQPKKILYWATEVCDSK